MRRSDRAITPEETQTILQSGTYGVLSLCGADTRPYAIPISYVYDGDAIFLHCALEGEKLAHIRQNNRASFCVVSEAQPLPADFSMRYQSAILQGTLREVEGEEKHQALLAFIEKYSPDYREKGAEYAAKAGNRTKVLKLTVDTLSGKRRK